MILSFIAGVLTDIFKARWSQNGDSQGTSGNPPLSRTEDERSFKRDNKEEAREYWANENSGELNSIRV